jgi:hypothetical protein
MEYLTNDRNAVRDATLSATNIEASNSTFRTDDLPKAGGGDVTLTGDYVGASDTTVDVKIVDTTITGTPKVSAPTFAGVGNGQMTDVSADNTLPAQVVTVTLQDLGTATLKAYAAFQGITLQAKASGSGGNDISVQVDRTSVTYAPTAFATQHDMTSGTNQFIGDEWNFGAAVLNADGTIPDSAPRIVFGADPQAYRQYKQYRNGQYVYGFSPVLVRDVPKGTVVNAVSGTMTVSILDSGVTEDSFTGVKTLYDALSAIRSGSTLVDVIGPVVNDKTPGGQGMVELSVWTSSYVTGIIGQGSDAAVHADLIVSPTSSAPSEALMITCKDATAVGGEVWSVFGDVSGSLADAITGVLYGDGPYAFTIPKPVVTQADTSNATINVEYIPQNPDAETVPKLCVVEPVIGAAGRAGVWEFVFTKRPTSDCDCASEPMSGGPNFDCLGIEPEGGNVSDDSRLLRLQRLTSWARSVIAVYATDPADIGDVVAVPWVDTVAKTLKSALDQLSSAVVLSGWQASQAYSIDKQIAPGNGYRYAVSVAGTSAGSAPTFPTTVGSTVTDGGVTWANIGKTAYALWDDYFAQVVEESRKLRGIAPIKGFSWVASTTLATASGGINVVYPTTRNGHLYAYRYANVNTDTTGATEPTWPTAARGATKDGTMQVVEVSQYWKASTPFTLGYSMEPGDGFIWVVTVAGTTGSSEPTWNANTVTDGSVTWARTSAASDIVSGLGDATVFFSRYDAMMDEVLAAGGIDPSFKGAGSDGDGCWLNTEPSHWWAYNGDTPYAPIINGVYYTTSTIHLDSDGREVIRTTKEWGLGVKFGCDEDLQLGDILRVTIGGSAVNAHGYQGGDNLAVSVNHATDLPLGGGQTGDDTLTWAVTGSISGRFADYELVTTSPAAYSDSGLTFTITPGGLPFGLSDDFKFYVEGGKFQFRRDGGSWSADEDIVDTFALSDGLVLNFIGGAGPSWVEDDEWSFKAEAINGVGGLRQPTDARCSWHDSTVISVTTAEDVNSVGLFDHTIPSNAVITFEGSDDNFATSPLSITLPWVAGNIYRALSSTVSYAKYRLSIDKGGSIQWLWIGEPLELKIPSGIPEIGNLTKRWRMPGLVSRRALGAQITHSFVAQPSIDDLLDGLSHACQYDDQRLGIVPNPAEPEAGIVTYATDTLELTEEFNFQPTTGPRYVSVSLQLDAVP